MDIPYKSPCNREELDMSFTSYHRVLDRCFAFNPLSVLPLQLAPQPQSSRQSEQSSNVSRIRQTNDFRERNENTNQHNFAVMSTSH